MCSSEKYLPSLSTEHGGGWGLVASPVFKTGVTRPSRAGWVRFPHSPAIARFLILSCAALVCSAALRDASAQRSDSTRAGVAQPARAASIDSARRPNVSPRRAFLMSLVAPGSMQLKFKRPKAAAIFFVAEAATVGMSVKSWSDLSKAKDARADTVGIPLVDLDGNPVIDPVTGQPQVQFVPKNPNLAGRIRARRAHLEDWIAAAVFNHLFAGADAYVAANLADFDANVQVSSGDRRMRVMARLAW